jgi:HAD superfamily hydrolase (TIGR01509 family)
MAIKAIIFDLDGVLIDTELLAFKAWQKKLSSLGIIFGDDDFRATLGFDAHQTAHYVQTKKSLAWDFQVLLDLHEKLMQSILGDDIEPMPGADGLVSDLFKQGYPLAVASNSSTAYVSRALKALHLDRFFQAVIGRDQALMGKPAPDVYLAAAAALSASPSQCVAIEDSSVGIKAAVAAGMCCLAIPNPSLPRSNFSLASGIFDSLPALHAALNLILSMN